LLDLLPNDLVDGRCADASSSIGEKLVEVRLEAKTVTVLLRGQEVAAIREGIQALLDVADVEARLGYGEANLRKRGLPALLPSVRLEQDRGRDLAVEPGLLQLWRGLGVEAQRVCVVFAGDVGGHRGLEPGLAELLEESCAEERVL